MFDNIGFGELMLIMIIALVVFGPQKLPELGRGLGSALREFKRATTEVKDDLARTLRDDDPPNPQDSTAHSPSSSGPN